MKSDMFVEVWKDIKDYEGLYQVSNLGRVRSLDHYVISKGGVRLVKGRIIKQDLVRGYLRVTLSNNGKMEHYLVHRLVAQVFISNPDNLPEVNHINEIKTDNRVENLEWCTREYNINYGNRNTLMAAKNTKPVLQYTLDGQFVAEYSSIKEAAKQNNIYQPCISSVLTGRYGCKTAGGYIWKYKTP